MLRTPLVKDVVIVVGVMFLVVAYNWSPYLAQKINWIPKTRRGQILWVFAAFGFILVYIICAYTVYSR